MKIKKLTVSYLLPYTINNLNESQIEIRSKTIKFFEENMEKIFIMWS
jgi:hypothetical protein